MSHSEDIARAQRFGFVLEDPKNQQVQPPAAVVFGPVGYPPDMRAVYGIAVSATKTMPKTSEGSCGVR